METLRQHLSIERNGVQLRQLRVDYSEHGQRWFEQRRLWGGSQQRSLHANI